MGDADDIRDLITTGTRKWTKQRKAEEKHSSARRMRGFRMRARREPHLTEALYTMQEDGSGRTIMEEAYLKASANGTLPANARQVMYAIRGKLQEITNRRLDDQYFTQRLLPDYISENNLPWNIAFDDRGHFTEPHTELAFGLGTINVRNYLRRIAAKPEPQFVDTKLADAIVKTLGPNGRFNSLLFIEKEGFDSLLSAVGIAQRYDIATMSSKGMSVTAARHLAEALCSRYGVKLLILHDFDRAGIIIKHTLHSSTRRYTFTSAFEVVDLGLRLDDVEEMELESEDPGGSNISDERLFDADATAEEIEFLKTGRVELNAMPSDQFVAFLEDKLEEHGIAKIVPDAATLGKTYQMFAKGEKLKAAFKEAEKAIGSEKDAGAIPADIVKRVGDILDEHPKIPWHLAVHSLLDPQVLPKTDPGR
jgi:hypothetical protein